MTQRAFLSRVFEIFFTLFLLFPYCAYLDFVQCAQLKTRMEFQLFASDRADAIHSVATHSTDTLHNSFARCHFSQSEESQTCSVSELFLVLVSISKYLYLCECVQSARIFRGSVCVEIHLLAAALLSFTFLL